MGGGEGASRDTATGQEEGHRAQPLPALQGCHPTVHGTSVAWQPRLDLQENWTPQSDLVTHRVSPGEKGATVFKLLLPELLYEGFNKGMKEEDRPTTGRAWPLRRRREASPLPRCVRNDRGDQWHLGHSRPFHLQVF